MADYATPSPDATPSPAETLRRAADMIRDDWPTPPRCCVEESHADRDFHLAVADWLDNSARHEVSGYAHAVARAYLGEAS